MAIVKYFFINFAKTSEYARKMRCFRLLHLITLSSEDQH